MVKDDYSESIKKCLTEKNSKCSYVQYIPGPQGPTGPAEEYNALTANSSLAGVGPGYLVLNNSSGISVTQSVTLGFAGSSASFTISVPANGSSFPLWIPNGMPYNFVIITAAITGTFYAASYVIPPPPA